MHHAQARELIIAANWRPSVASLVHMARTRSAPILLGVATRRAQQAWGHRYNSWKLLGTDHFPAQLAYYCTESLVFSPVVLILDSHLFIAN